jgi:hypothetical protein
MKKFTTQEVIDMGADLYDNHGFTRDAVWTWLTALDLNGCTEGNYDISRIFDLLV